MLLTPAIVSRLRNFKLTIHAQVSKNLEQVAVCLAQRCVTSWAILHLLTSSLVTHSGSNCGMNAADDRRRARCTVRADRSCSRVTPG